MLGLFCLFDVVNFMLVEDVFRVFFVVNVGLLN